MAQDFSLEIPDLEEKVVAVNTFDSRFVVVSIGKESVKFDKDALGTFQRALGQAFQAVS